MRRFQIIRLDTNSVRLVETHTYNGVCKEFEGKTCISDALRFMRRICSDAGRTFEIFNANDHDS